MAGHTGLGGNRSVRVPKEPLPPAAVFRFLCLPVCPSVRPVIPAVAQEPGKLPPEVFLTTPSLAGPTRHGNTRPGIRML